VCFWLTQIPPAFWLAKGIELGPNGAFVAMVIAERLLTAMGVVLFRRGNWKIRTA
jgi:Na+-driven multidrug efflux pump